ncbi:MAG: type II toxin-antitoxin system HipA family toxin [Acidobacteriota bacterium]
MLEQLEVRLTHAPGEERVVGRLAESQRRLVFEYDAEFLRDPIWLSPFKLPPEPGVREHRDLDFGPIFGLFDDSLPDGWGLLLMDRFFRQQGLELARVSVLDRLAHLGTRTMGALTYHPPRDVATSAGALDLQRLATESRRVLRGRTHEVLPQLLRAGGSPGGARPKVLVGVGIGDRAGELLSGEDMLPPDVEPWIVKFFADEDTDDAGAVELAYASMARDAGLTMPATRLFAVDSGERYFGVRRFDRVDGRRLHVHTFGNLIHANYRLPSADYRQLLQVTRVLTRHRLDLLEAFRRAAFNVASHNRDDHVKNFAFCWTAVDDWRLAPAYDLTHSSGPGGEHSTTIAGEGRAPGRSHLLQLADEAKISRQEATRMLEQVVAAVERWNDHAEAAGVGGAARRRIADALDLCLERLR